MTTKRREELSNEEKREDLDIEGFVEFLKADDKAGPRRFSMLSNTGVDMPRWWGNFALDLKGITVPAKLPILVNHETDKVDEGVVGFADAHELTTKGLELRGVISEATKAAALVKQLADEGFPWTASVGVFPASIETVAQGAEVEVNGRKFKGPGEVWRTSRLGESSFVTSWPADPGTDAQVLRLRLQAERATMSLEEQIKKAKDEAAAEALKAQNDRLTQFLQAFPDDQPFAVAQHLSGVSLTEAKAARSERLSAKVTELSAALKQRDEADAAKKKAIEDLKGKTDKNGPGFAGAEREAADGGEDLSGLEPESRAKQELAKAPQLKAMGIVAEDLAAFHTAQAKRKSPISEDLINRMAAALG